MHISISYKALALAGAFFMLGAGAVALAQPDDPTVVITPRSQTGVPPGTDCGTTPEGYTECFEPIVNPDGSVVYCYHHFSGSGQICEPAQDYSQFPEQVVLPPEWLCTTELHNGVTVTRCIPNPDYPQT